jgi:outer membrane PBP1 activator LpoA protein
MLSWVNEALTQLGVAVAAAAGTAATGRHLLPGADANVREGYKVPQQIALLLPGDGNFAAASESIREGFSPPISMPDTTMHRVPACACTTATAPPMAPSRPISRPSVMARN